MSFWGNAKKIFNRAEVRSVGGFVCCALSYVFLGASEAVYNSDLDDREKTEKLDGLLFAAGVSLVPIIMVSLIDTLALARRYCRSPCSTNVSSDEETGLLSRRTTLPTYDSTGTSTRTSTSTTPGLN